MTDARLDQSLVYGQPIQSEGVTVIPVSRAAWGFGVGGGGVNGGGGARLTPIGFIEIRDKRARFRPIYDLRLVLELILATGGLLILLRVLASR